jgi:hypothetical protein
MRACSTGVFGPASCSAHRTGTIRHRKGPGLVEFFVPLRHGEALIAVGPLHTINPEGVLRCVGAASRNYARSAVSRAVRSCNPSTRPIRPAVTTAKTTCRCATLFRFAARSYNLRAAQSHFDRVEIGRIGRQIKKDYACRFEELTHAGDSMGGQTVHDDDVAFCQRRDQGLFEPGQKDFAVHGPVNDVRRSDGVVAQARNEGCRFPMAARRASDQPLASLHQSIRKDSLISTDLGIRQNRPSIQIN